MAAEDGTRTPRWWIVVPLCTLLSVVVFEQILATQEQVVMGSVPAGVDRLQVIQLVCEEEQQLRNITCDSKDISSKASSWIRWVQVSRCVCVCTPCLIRLLDSPWALSGLVFLFGVVRYGFFFFWSEQLLCACAASFDLPWHVPWRTVLCICLLSLCTRPCAL